MKDKKFIQLLIVFGIAITALGAVSLFFFLSKNNHFIDNLSRSRPAKIQIVKILDKNCPDCFDIERILSKVRSANVKIKSERLLDAQDAEARSLISKYGIERLPTFIVSGDINRNNELILLWKTFGQKFDNNKTFVLTRVFPPYVLADTGEVRGRFSLIYLTDVTCDDCYDVTRHEVALGNLGLNITDENSRVLDVGSEKGHEFIKKYSIKHAPTIILQGELNEYAPLFQVWSQVGTIEDDGAYVFRENGEKIMGPYKDLPTGEILNSK